MPLPYIAHLLAVAALVLEHGGDEDEAIAALLHDAIEDQGGHAARRQIAERFGPRVAAIVEGATETDLQPKPPWRERKEEHLARLHEADRSVQLVVAADKLHNARSLIADYGRLGEALWSHFRGGKAGTLWYLAPPPRPSPKHRRSSSPTSTPASPNWNGWPTTRFSGPRARRQREAGERQENLGRMARHPQMILTRHSSTSYRPLVGSEYSSAKLPPTNLALANSPRQPTACYEPAV